MDNIERDEVKLFDKKRGDYYYEKCFVPEKDDGLKKLGIEVCAITSYSEGKLKNRMVFKRGKYTSDVNCVHTAVCQVIKNPESDTGFEVVSTEKRPDLLQELSIEDHYFALKSFTQALVENGVQQTLINALERGFETGQEPMDFNEQMRSQLTDALIKIAPEETKELTLSALEYISAGNTQRFTIFSRNFSQVICGPMFNAEDVRKLDSINGGISELDNDLKRCLLNISDIPNDILYKIGVNANSDVMNQLLNNRTLPANVLNDFIKNSIESGRTSVIEEIARRSNIPIPVIRTLADLNNVMVNRLISDNVNIPSDVVEKIKSGDSITRQILAHNSGIDPNQLQGYEMDEDDSVRLYFAVREGLSIDTLSFLANDKNPQIRSVVANNPSTPKDAIRKLAFDPEVDVREVVAKRHNLDQEVMRELIKRDMNERIARALSERDDLPQDIVDKIALSGYQYPAMSVLQSYLVSNDVKMRILDGTDLQLKRVLIYDKVISEALMWKVLEDSDDSVRFALAHRSDLPKAVMITLARDSDLDVRSELVKNVNLPDDILDVLANDKNGFVRLDVARRNKLPPYIMKKLALDKELEVRRALSIREDIPVDVLLFLAQDSDIDIKLNIASSTRRAPKEVVDILINDVNTEIKDYIAYNYDLTDDQIRKLAKDKDPKIRYLIASMSDLPIDVVSGFLSDQDHKIVNLSKQKIIDKNYKI